MLNVQIIKLNSLIIATAKSIVYFTDVFVLSS